MLSERGIWFPIARLLPGVIVKLWQRWRLSRRKLPNDERLRLRQKWKGQIEPYILKTRRQKLRQDVIIRDMRRMDDYPELPRKARGISPWFRVGLIDTYHRGALVAFEWRGFCERPDGSLRTTDWEAGEQATRNLLVAAKIPYEWIESIDFDGDEFYGFPHIYCYFVGRAGGPYEHIGCYEEIDFDGRPLFREVTDYRSTLPNRWLRFKHWVRRKRSRRITA